MMFSINSSIFLFSPIFLFFIIGQMVPTICGMPMMNDTSNGNETIMNPMDMPPNNDTDTIMSPMEMPSSNGNDTIGPLDMPSNNVNESTSTLEEPMPMNSSSDLAFNFTSRLDDQNRDLLDKFLNFGKEMRAEMGPNGTCQLSNETLAKFKDLHFELFDAIDEDKDGNLTREELYLYGLEVVIPFLVEFETKNMTSAQRDQYLANLNANVELAKENVELTVDQLIEEYDQNEDGILTKEELEMELDKMATMAKNNGDRDLHPMAHHLKMLKANFL